MLKVRYNPPEVWYKFHYDFWRKVYATGWLKVVIKFGFENLHLNRKEAGDAIANTHSIKVMKRRHEAAGTHAPNAAVKYGVVQSLWL